MQQPSLLGSEKYCWWILRSWSVSLARNASKVLSMLLPWELCPAHTGFICRDSITAFPLRWLSEPLGRCLRNSDQGHCKNMPVWPSERWGCFLGALSLDDYGEFCGGPLRPCHDKQTKQQQRSGVDAWNCMREEFGYWTSSVLSELVCISDPFTRNDLDTFYPCSRQKLGHGHTLLQMKVLNLKYRSYASYVVIAVHLFDLC